LAKFLSLGYPKKKVGTHQGDFFFVKKRPYFKEGGGGDGGREEKG